MSGRGVPAPVQIISDEDVLTIPEIKLKDYRSQNIYLKTNLEIIQFLVKNRLLYNKLLCKCGTEMSFIVSNRSIDGYCWKCKNCKTISSIRSSSYFSRSHLSLNKLLCSIYFWSRNYRQTEIAYELKLNKNCRTVVDWCSYNRKLCGKYLTRNFAIGGLNNNLTSKTVEIGITKFFHKKHGRSEGHLVFGGIERDSDDCFMIEIPDRSPEILYPIIEQLVI